ncbi:hypothetical protein QGP82_18720 [Leptothoe sp. LEGE 181152]|nr:hypothetical protein [Leptothoe sp. LEGE 181152]
MKLTNGMISIPKDRYLLTLDFGPWLEKLTHHQQYVLVHSQDRPVGVQKWGVLVVDGDQVDYHQAVKVESVQPHDCWTLSNPNQFTPVLAVVYPACCIGQNNNTISIESIGFMEKR